MIGGLVDAGAASHACEGADVVAHLSSLVADLAERAGWTALQSFFAVLLATGSAGTVVDLPWRFALSMAAGAAVVSVVTTLLQYLTPLRALTFWPDLLLRLAKTFLASLGGSVGADAFDVLAFDWSGAFDLAVVTMLSALAKGLVAGGSAPSDEATPSTLAKRTYELATGRVVP